MTFIKNNIAFLICIGIIIFLLFKDGCAKSNAPTGIKSSDTTTKIVYITQPTQIIKEYIPTSSGSQQPIIIPREYAQNTSSNDILEIKKQLAELAKNHYTTNLYNDSISLKDSVGTNVGVVNWNGKVTENKLVSFGANYKLKFPKETIIVTNTLYPKPVTQLYLGGGLSGDKINLLNSAEIGGILKTKKDNLYGLNGGINIINFQPYIKASYYFKLKLK